MTVASGHSTRSAPRDPAPRRVRVLAFRVVAALSGLFFVVAVVLNAAGPWALLMQAGDPHADLHRWFFALSGAVDAILAGCLLALAYRPRFTLLVVDIAFAVVVAGAVILPFDVSFVIILTLGILPLALYPYWRDARGFPRW